MSEQEIYIEAMYLEDSADRAQFVDEACGDDSALRERVYRLIGHSDQVGSFLESPAAAVAATVTTPPVTEGPGTRIGPYKLREQIGEGGFGIVFLAEQTEPVKRRVALKIIKPGMDTREVIARFEAERQALALMDHPNIAKVLDAGTTESPLSPPGRGAGGEGGGRPYFVMELVKGIPITDYCDQCQLPTRQRLELFVQVCHAIRHAHQKGIIHRDVKPSNVLIAMQDGNPAPKVIDFGVAKAINQRLTEQTLLTGFAQMVGTPLYMSPEQAEMSPLDVDTRSDIYSLGVLLYELLTGTTPFTRERLKEASYDELRRIIREEEPARPSARISTLGADITTIAEKRRTEPRKLRQMVRGDLDWIALKALEKDRTRRYETVNSLAADVRRYLDDQPVEACPPSVAYRLKKFTRRNRATLVTTVGVLATVVVAASLGWIAHRRGLEKAESEAQRAAAVAAAENARLDALVEEGLRLSSGWQPEFSRAIDNFTSVIEVRPDDAEILLLRGSTYCQAGRPSEAIPDLKRSLELNPEDNAAAHALLARAYQETGNESEAAEHLRLAQADDADNFDALIAQALALRFDERALDLLDRAYESRLPDLNFYYYSGLLAGNLAMTRGRQADYDRAIEHLEKAVSIRPDEWRYRELLCQDLLVLDSARVSHSDARARAGVLLDQWLRDHPDDVRALMLQMSYLSKIGQPPESVIEVGLKIQMLDPGYVGHAAVMAQQYGRLGRIEEALTWWNQAVETSATGYLLGRRAMLLAHMGRVDQARDDITRAQKIDAEVRTEGEWWTLCLAWEELHDFESQLRTAREWISLADESGFAHHHLGLALRNLGRLNEAADSYERAFDLHSGAIYAVRCAELHRELQQWDQMLDILCRALALHPLDEQLTILLTAAVQDCDDPDSAIEILSGQIRASPEDSTPVLFLARSLVRERLDQDEQAQGDFDRYLKLQGATDGDLAARIGFLKQRAEYARQRDDLEGALAHIAVAIQLDDTDSDAYGQRGMYFALLDDLPQALADLDLAIDLNPDSYTAWERRCWIRTEQGQYDAAIADGRQALRIEPHGLYGHLRLGEAYFAQEAYQDLLAFYDSAGHIGPDVAIARYNCGRARIHLGDLGRGIAELEQAVRLSPNVSLYRNWLYRGYSRLERKQLRDGDEEGALAARQKNAEFLLGIPVVERNVGEWGKLGQVLYKLNRWDESRQAFQTNLELRGETAPTLHQGPRWWLLAILKARTGDTESAREIYDQLVRELEENPPTYDIEINVTPYKTELEELLGLTEDTT